MRRTGSKNKISYCPDCVNFRTEPGWWWCAIKCNHNAVLRPPCEDFKQSDRIQEYIFKVNAEGFHFSSKAFTYEELTEIKNFALKLREARLSETQKEQPNDKL